MDTEDAAAVRIALTVAEPGAGKPGQLLRVVREGAPDVDGAAAIDFESRSGPITPDLRVGASPAQAVPLKANKGMSYSWKSGPASACSCATRSMLSSTTAAPGGQGRPSSKQALSTGLSSIHEVHSHVALRAATIAAAPTRAYCRGGTRSTCRGPEYGERKARLKQVLSHPRLSNLATVPYREHHARRLRHHGAEGCKAADAIDRVRSLWLMPLPSYKDDEAATQLARFAETLRVATPKEKETEERALNDLLELTARLCIVQAVMTDRATSGLSGRWEVDRLSTPRKGRVKWTPVFGPV